jgi:hypothetical protein
MPRKTTLASAILFERIASVDDCFPVAIPVKHRDQPPGVATFGLTINPQTNPIAYSTNRRSRALFALRATALAYESAAADGYQSDYLPQ